MHTQCSSFFFNPWSILKNIVLLWVRKIIFLRISHLQIKSLAISGLVKDKNKPFSTVLNTILGHEGEHICRVSFVCPVCTFSQAIAVNFTGSQAHSFMFPSSSKLKIFFLKRTMTKAIWVSDILKEKPISDHLYGWSLLPTAGRCHGDLLDISILSECDLTVFGWHHKWSHNIEISSCRAKGPLVEIQGRQNHCWREVCHSLIWLSFCVVYARGLQWPHDARWLIKACADRKCREVAQPQWGLCWFSNL